MIALKKIILSLSLVLLFLVGLGFSIVFLHPLSSATVYGSSNAPANIATAAAVSSTSVSTLCNISPGHPAGVYGHNSGAFVLDNDTGNILWCTGGSSKVIFNPASPSALFSDIIADHRIGLGGVSTSIGTVLVADQFNTNAGCSPNGFCSAPPEFYYCMIASSNGCEFSSLYLIPGSFCLTMPIGVCHPHGITLDSKLNIYYADPDNAVIVKCVVPPMTSFPSSFDQTGIPASCSKIETLSSHPASIFRASNGDIWVSDSGCAGIIWKNDAVYKSIPNTSLGGITISSSNPSLTPHVYVAVDNTCPAPGTGGYVLDVSDGNSLPSPLAIGGTRWGLGTGLQFSDSFSGNVYHTSDTS